MNPENEKPARLFAASLDEVSAALGTTERQWRTYAKRPGFPAKIPGKGYDLAALAAWKDENIAQRGSGELASLKADKIKRDIQLADLRIAREEGKSVLRADVDERDGRIAMRLRATLYAKLDGELPAKLAGCDALAIRKALRGAADELVAIFAREIDEWEPEN